MTCRNTPGFPREHGRKLGLLGTALRGVRRRDHRFRPHRRAGVDADLATFIRTVLILLLLATLVGVRRKWMNPASLPPRTLLFLALSALATAASWVCYFRALQIGRASQVAPVDRLSLVLVALFAFAFLGERPTGQDWLGIALVTAGVLALTSSKLFE